MAALEKTPVLNPLTLRNTVGRELADIFEARDIKNFEDIIGINNLKSKERLSKKTLEKASEILGNSEVCEYLSNFQKEYFKEKPRYEANYRQAKKTYTKLKCVLPLLRGEFTEGYDILDDILDFFGVDSDTEIFETSERQAALFRTQNKVTVDPINLHAWLRRGELDFKELNLSDYNESELMNWIKSKIWMDHIEDVEYFKSLPTIFLHFGVGLVFVPSLPKTVYGAIRWIDNKPLIQISDREHDLASCWFTLFHELGHAIKHKNVEIFEGNINESKAKQDKREKDANKFANEHLFNGDNLRKAVFERKRRGEQMTANSLAKEFNVPSIFTSYWLRKAQYAPFFQRRIQIDFVSQYQ
ncbi:MAG: ImmA/IrrE family metallo-endopeptidase [Bacteroidaceae bacterium]|nr:ImmA/IrrE family metallo-endopeptidase [Bacteroidaceae bacterium]